MKLTRNLKILIVLIVSAYLIDLSNGLKAGEKSTEANTESHGIFSMKHKKTKTSTATASTVKKATSTTQNKAQVAAATSAKVTVANKKATSTMTNKNANTNKNKQPMTDNLMGADSDLLKQTGLLAAAMAAGKQMPKDKKRIDLEKMGPIAFHNWVKFFKYTDQVASDKNAKIRFNQNRKFFTNGEFREQLKYYPGENYQEMDGEGEYKYVSDPQRFYLVAFKSSVVIYQSKMVNFKKIKKIIKEFTKSYFNFYFLINLIY
jgi:hypothetical protein